MRLNVIPSPTLGLHLQDREFRSCLCYWLGVSDQFTCPECHGVADSFGTTRWDVAAVDVVFNAAQSAASKETPGLIPDSAPSTQLDPSSLSHCLKPHGPKAMPSK